MVPMVVIIPSLMIMSKCRRNQNCRCNDGRADPVHVLPQEKGWCHRRVHTESPSDGFSFHCRRVTRSRVISGALSRVRERDMAAGLLGDRLATAEHETLKAGAILCCSTLSPGISRMVVCCGSPCGVPASGAVMTRCSQGPGRPCSGMVLSHGRR
jgi:hypothetical protein